MKKLLIPMLLLILTLNACSNSGKIEITFDTNGGSEITSVKVEEGSLLTLPADPISNGYDFDAWYTDTLLTVMFDETIEITEDITLYAKWTVKPVNEDTSLPYYSYMSSDNPVVTITVIGVGDITIELFPDLAKNTVDNFIKYIQDGDYVGSIFHRIIADFMIQGGIVSTTDCSIKGDFSSNGVSNDLSHFRGVISMARTSVKNSATSQFFIVHQDSLFLDGSYAGFGGVTSGFDILDYLADTAVGSNDKPLTDFVIEGVTVELNGYVPGSPVCAD